MAQLERQHWQPLAKWFLRRFGLQLGRTHGILPLAHPPETLTAMHGILARQSDWFLGALQVACHASHSFIVPLAMADGHISAEYASFVAFLEVHAQIEQWGVVPFEHNIRLSDARSHLAAAALILRCTADLPPA